MPSPGDHPDRLQPVAAVLACALPGAGQFFLGYRARGIAIMVGVLGLFLGGVLIGGINCVDSRENRIWFIGQALVGPAAFIIDNIHQSQFKAYPPGADGRPTGLPRVPRPDETIVDHPSGRKVLASSGGKPPPIVKSIGRPNELGTLFGAIAGMLNLICIIDAAWSCRREEFEEMMAERAEAEKAAAARGAGAVA